MPKARGKKTKTLTLVLHKKTCVISYWHIFVALLIVFGWFVVGYLLGYKLLFLQ